MCIRPGIALAMVAALFLLGVSWAFAIEQKSGGLWGLAVWEGKLPGGSVDGKTSREFWNEPGLKPAAERGLGAALVKEIIEDQTLRYWDDVKKYKQTLVARYCVQHNCGFNNITLFIDMDKGEVSACVHGMKIGKSVQTDVHEDYFFAQGHSRTMVYDSCRKMYDALQSGK